MTCQEALFSEVKPNTGNAELFGSRQEAPLCQEHPGAFKNPKPLLGDPETYSEQITCLEHLINGRVRTGTQVSETPESSSVSPDCSCPT